MPASKLLLGVGFYGRGWTGVTQAAPGGTATGAAPGKYEAGIEDYKLISTRCPSPERSAVRRTRSATGSGGGMTRPTRSAARCRTRTTRDWVAPSSGSFPVTPVTAR